MCVSVTGANQNCPGLTVASCPCNGDGPGQSVELDISRISWLQGVRVYSFADFEQIGIDNPAQPSPPRAQDPACIMYTSGTTGTWFNAWHPPD